MQDNRPLLRSKNPHFQIEAKCITFLVTMSFICMRMKNHFYIKGWALNIVLIELRHTGTRKWPIWKENLVVLQKSLRAFPSTLMLLAILSEGTDWCLAAKKGVAWRDGIKGTLPSWERVGGESFFFLEYPIATMQDIYPNINIKNSNTCMKTRWHVA